ncbi:hypothetical protein [Castellaniella caeni]|uniref:hypothetical protein n=1 Tax=Castellaniella caeni TaxID=266123 RepID=UPI000C9FEF6E|nr:hypothetical protein [Castellaniella caeni]
MSTQHTPGPWGVRFDFVVQAKSFDSGRLVPVAQPYGVNSDGTDLFANARLIAAAPDLLEALKMALEYWADRQQRYKNRAPVWVRDARAAIARAEGK